MTTEAQSPMVLIAGAGPSGLVLASELRRDGIRAAGVTKQSRALGLNARTLEVFDMMGTVEPDVTAAGIRGQLRSAVVDL